MRLSLDAHAAFQTLKLIEEDFRAPLAQRALIKAARIMHPRAKANAEAAKDTGFLASKVLLRYKKPHEVKVDREVFAGVGTLGGGKKIERNKPYRGKSEYHSYRTSTPNKYAHLVEGGVPKYKQAPRPLYKAAYTASLHEMEQVIVKTVNKGLELAIRNGKAKRPLSAPTGQGSLALS